MNVRTILQHRIRSLGWSNYRLAKAVKGKVPLVSVYDFLRGDSEMTAKNLGHVLSAVGMQIVPDSNWTPKPVAKRNAGARRRKQTHRK